MCYQNEPITSNPLAHSATRRSIFICIYRGCWIFTYERSEETIVRHLVPLFSNVGTLSSRLSNIGFVVFGVVAWVSRINLYEYFVTFFTIWNPRTRNLSINTFNDVFIPTTLCSGKIDHIVSVKQISRAKHIFMSSILNQMKRSTRL